MNMDFMKSQIELAKSDKIDEAISRFSTYYDYEKIKYEILFLNRTEMTRIRIPLIELAFIDYKEARFHAMIPIILMMIDGIVNAVTGKGFHFGDQELDAWDSITTIDNGLDVIQSIFRKGRFKTRVDEIEEPYRNGILHGLDLGYANEKVALKCWHYLFVIRDWAQPKITEEERHNKFIIDNSPPDLADTLTKIKKTDTVKKKLDKWKQKQYSAQYIEEINTNRESVTTEEPEYTVVQFFRWLEKKNYKALSELFWKHHFYSDQPKIPSIKNEYSHVSYSKLNFTKIVNEAPSITEVYVETDIKALKFRLLYESQNDDVAIPSLKNGSWKIVGIQEV